MRTILLLFLVFHSTQVVSQSSPDSLFVPSVGTVCTHSVCDTTGVDSSAGGPAQFFDYSFLNTIGSSTTSYVDPAIAAGFSSFPDATLAVNFPSYTRFYRTTPDSFLYIGSYTPSSGNTDKWGVGLNEQLLHMEYDSLYIDSTFMTYYTPSPEYRMVIRKWKLDAYGQLLLPTAAFDTVFRIRCETTFHLVSNHSIVYERYINYKFISPDLKRSVLDIHYNLSSSAANKSVKYEESVTGIEELSHDGLLVYPNPFSSELFMQVPTKEQVKYIQLVDVSGVVHFDAQYTSNPESIRFPPGLTSGIYILSIKTKDHMFRKKVIKQ